MSEVLHANIFFLITSVAVVVFTILICFILYHVLKIVRSIRRLTERLEQGSEILSEDIAELRRFFREGTLISHLMGMFMRRRSRHNSRKDEE